MLLSVGGFCSNRRLEVNFFMVVYGYTYACTVKPDDITKVKNALLKPVCCVTEGSSGNSHIKVGCRGFETRPS